MKLLVLAVLLFSAVQLSGCGDVQCDDDSDCNAGEVCADAGGVFFASRVCVAALPTSNMPDMSMSDGGSDACVARTSKEICDSLGATCGSPSVMDCGMTVAPDCGRCDANQRCNDDFECECVPETDAEFCSRFGADCDEVTNLDNCGLERSVDCGECTGGDTCGEFQTNVCGCPCEIDNICYPANAVNPNNPCERCLPQTADDQWTITQGSTCSDNDLCTENDACDATGTCVGEMVMCQAKSACEVAACDATNGACFETPIADGEPCGEDDGLTCSQSLCFGGICERQIDGGTCLINDACYNGGDENPVAPCQLCRPFESQTDWSFENAGRRCGEDGPNCTEGRCDGLGNCVIEIDNGECLIDGVCINDNDENPLNECEECIPAESQTTWSPAKAGQNCGPAGMICECDGAGACLDGMGGVCL